MRLLAGDVGGTKTLLALFDGDGQTWSQVRAERYASADHGSLEEIVASFVRGDDLDIDAVGIGVAGPVSAGRSKVTNLPWEIDAARVGAAAREALVALVNDFTAVALGIRSLGADQLHLLHEGEVDADGPAAILGAGTGLGEAIVVPRGDGTTRVLPTEGGHTDFAPRDELEIGLLRFLLERHNRVSVERVVSGPGLASVYEYVATRHAAGDGAALRRVLDADDPGAAVSEAATRADPDPAALRAVQVWVSLYGAEAGNLALKTLPTGGLYVAGGIAPRMLPALERYGFVDSFLRKGRMRRLLDKIRVSVITEPRVGLLGARNAALDLVTAAARTRTGSGS